MLSDITIRRMIEAGDIRIDSSADMYPWQFQPVSIDLRLDSILDKGFPSDMLTGGGYGIGSGQFILGSTIETITLSRNIVAQVHGKSTRAREGLIVHAAGLVDPGFSGQLTLEMYNMSDRMIWLCKGMLICQVTFDALSTTPERTYGNPELHSRYQFQKGPTPARNQ